MIIHKESKWLKAAVIGSIWAAIEIIAGSFLHNLRLPFAGTLLSMTSVVLLVTFMNHWKESGIIIRAGIVCALMKSISPSAIIFGPMVAIFMEALILETVTLVLGRNLLSFMLAGSLAVVWALVQKVVNFIILFGFDIIRVADSFFQFLVKKTGMENLPPIYLVLIVTGAYLLAGALAGAIGHLTVRQRLSAAAEPLQIRGSARSGQLNIGEFSSFSTLHILFILAMAPLLLYLINVSMYPVFLPLGFAYIVYILLRYKQSVRYIRKPKVWIQFLVVALIATLLWEWISTGVYLSVEGLLAGLKMIFRAMVIIFSFSALSVELRNPLVRSILQRNGFSNLYVAMQLAFTALPAIIETLPQFKNLVSRRNHVLRKILLQSDLLLEQFSREVSPRENIVVITGATQSGKTKLARVLIERLRKENYRPGGILAHGSFLNNERYEFYIEEITTGNRFCLARKQPAEGWMEFRRYYFDPQSFKRGNEILQQSIDNASDIIFLDEIGPLELQGKGWYPALEQLKSRRHLVQVWIVREKLVKEVIRNSQIPPENIYSGEEPNTEEIYNKLIEMVRTIKG